MSEKKIIYKIEILFQEDLRGVVREKLKELKEIVDSYYQVRKYMKESFGVN